MAEPRRQRTETPDLILTSTTTLRSNPDKGEEPSLNDRQLCGAAALERYSFGRYFSPLHPNRPRDLDALEADNDVVLYDPGK
jgi:hypothetical protein